MRTSDAIVTGTLVVLLIVEVLVGAIIYIVNDKAQQQQQQQEFQQKTDAGYKYVCIGAVSKTGYCTGRWLWIKP